LVQNGVPHVRLDQRTQPAPRRWSGSLLPLWLPFLHREAALLRNVLRRLHQTFLSYMLLSICLVADLPVSSVT